jgi:large subunit ribosomal protein L36
MFRPQLWECPAQQPVFRYPGPALPDGNDLARELVTSALRRQREHIMKVRNSLRGLKARPGSIVVRRRGRTFVVNKKDPRQKARQG